MLVPILMGNSLQRTAACVNEKVYGQKVSPNDIRSGEIPRPPAAQPLYDALKRCHVYARDNFFHGIRDSGSQNLNASVALFLLMM
mmetsp:Transcript_18870/g.27989  ORF Transcript_18870/g.27989 Transcript_18870/m.27989 type:complete len:85 (-) Transcript_18870:542-796(-)